MTVADADVLIEMDKLRVKFLKQRAYFPYMNIGKIGKKQFKTAPIYSRMLNTDIAFVLDKPLF